jgi:hypothetical protein
MVCSLQPHQHGRPSSRGEDDAWWRHPDQLRRYHGVGGFMGEWPQHAPSL